MKKQLTRFQRILQLLPRLGLSVLMCAVIASEPAMAAPRAIEELIDGGIYGYDPKDECGPETGTSTGDSSFSSPTLQAEWKAIFDRASVKFGIDGGILAAIFWVENRGFKPPNHPFESAGSVKGPFQFEVSTWAGHAQDGDQPPDGRENILDPDDAAFGAAHLIKSLGGSPGIAMGSLTQNFPRRPSATEKTVAYVAKSYNAGGATFRDASGVWQRGSEGAWSSAKQKEITEYVALTIFVYDKLKKGEAIPPFNGAFTDAALAFARGQGGDASLPGVTPDTPSSANAECNNSAEGEDACYGAVMPTINDKAALGTALNTYIKANAPANSPFQNKGSDFVEGSVRQGVNPLLIVAIAQKESSFGTSGIATQGTNNAFGRTAGPSQPQVNINGRAWYKYGSFVLSINGPGTPSDQPSFIKKEYIEERGLTTIADVITTYAPPSENNTQDYIAQLNDWIGKMIAAAGPALTCGGGGGSATGGYDWPIKKAQWPGVGITSCFGPRPPMDDHGGIDIGVGDGTPVYAAQGGEVVEVRTGASGSTGRMVGIKHPDNIYSTYMHLQTVKIRKGQKVSKGQQIATSDTTGAGVTGAHLHFQMNKGKLWGDFGSGAVNPIDYLPKDRSYGRPCRPGPGGGGN